MAAREGRERERETQGGMETPEIEGEEWSMKIKDIQIKRDRQETWQIETETDADTDAQKKKAKQVGRKTKTI